MPSGRLIDCRAVVSSSLAKPATSLPCTLAVTVTTRRVPWCDTRYRPVVRSTSATDCSETMRPLTFVSGMRRSCSGRRREAESRMTTTSVVRLPSKTWATVAPRVAVSTASRASSGRSPTLARSNGRSRTVTSGATGGGSYCTSVAPGTRPMVSAMRRAERSRLSRSSPKSFTTTCAVEPVSVSSIRSARKPRMAKLTPGMPSSVRRRSSCTVSASLPVSGTRSTSNSV